ncbi:hypothetical protein DPMN_035420 [Dreissena polymorpha]|uniref:Uncharacterized protein n=1 Tax=Dreissena polymorpha TaxID=45954 RepID=A0A9D4RMY8_DREPO|nr:hypothetical protein DPMN_035420 [Dreissena polymorpha]
MYIQPRPSSYEESQISWMYLNDSQLANDPLVDEKIAKAAVTALQNFANGWQIREPPVLSRGRFSSATFAVCIAGSVFQILPI